MKELDDYVINCETLMIMPCGGKRSRVYEYDEVFIVNRDAISIINDSCLYFGSSLAGRRDGTKALMNCEIKVPIIIEDSQNLIFFPTSSYRNSNNVWISYNNLLKYSKNSMNGTLLFFKQDNKIAIDVRYNIIDNQIIRCIKLEAIISKRKNYSLISEK